MRKVGDVIRLKSTGALYRLTYVPPNTEFQPAWGVYLGGGRSSFCVSGEYKYAVGEESRGLTAIDDWEWEDADDFQAFVYDLITEANT